MNIIIALNNVITVLRQTHVSGAEAKNYGQAIDLLTMCVKALEESKQKGEEQHADHDKQGENV